MYVSIQHICKNLPERNKLRMEFSPLLASKSIYGITFIYSNVINEGKSATLRVENENASGQKIEEMRFANPTSNLEEIKN